jgi:hypothetical protein
LTAAPEEELRRVCEYVGEEFHPAMLEFHRTKRAAQLRDKPEFSNVSRGLFQPAAPDAQLGGGLRGRIATRLVETGHRAAAGLSPDPALPERGLRACLFARAALWEVRQPQFRDRIRRRIEHWRGASTARRAGMAD